MGKEPPSHQAKAPPIYSPTPCRSRGSGLFHKFIEQSRYASGIDQPRTSKIPAEESAPAREEVEESPDSPEDRPTSSKSRRARKPAGEKVAKRKEPPAEAEEKCQVEKKRKTAAGALQELSKKPRKTTTKTIPAPIAAVVAVDDFVSEGHGNGRPQRARCPVLASWRGEKAIYSREPGSATPRVTGFHIVPESQGSKAESEVNGVSGVNGVNGVNGYQVLTQDQDAPVLPTEDPIEEQVPLEREDVASLHPNNSMDVLGPVCSEQERQSCNATESAVTNQNTLAQREDPTERESSQPLLSTPPEEDPEAGSAGSAGSASNLSQRSGMEGLARLFGNADYWGDSLSELSQNSRPRRSRPLAWGDGLSETVISTSRSETKESFDWDMMFSPQARGDDMV